MDSACRSKTSCSPSTSVPRILIVSRGIAIAFGTLAGNHRLALRIACETAVYASLSIGRAILAVRYDGWSPTVCRSWRRGESKRRKCHGRPEGYLTNRLHNFLQQG